MTTCIERVYYLATNTKNIVEKHFTNCMIKLQKLTTFVFPHYPSIGGISINDPIRRPL